MSQTGSSVADLLNSILSHKEEPGYAYGSLWPTRYKVDAQGNPVHGSLSFDPGAGMLGTLARSAHELLTTPGQVASGQKPLTRDLGPKLAGDMFNLGTGAGAMGGPSGRSVAGIFVGPGKYSDLDLATAESMENQNAHPDEIWRRTGLFRGGDTKWRREISDSRAKLRTHKLEPGAFTRDYYYAQDPDLKLRDVLDHPELYSEKPELKNYAIGQLPFEAVNGGTTGQFDPTSKQINLFGGSAPTLLSTVLHETQHAIDHLERRQYGANTDMFLSQGVRKMAEELPEKRQAISERMKSEGRPGQAIGYSTGMGGEPITHEFDPDETDKYIDQLHSAVQKHLSGQPMPGYERSLLATAAHEPWLNDFMDYSVQRGAVSQANRKAYDMYNKTGGEVMARNVQNRLKGWQPDLFKGRDGNMVIRQPDGFLTAVTPESFQYGLLSPMKTEDVRRSEQIWQPHFKWGQAGSETPPGEDGSGPLFRTNPFRLADEHQQDVTRLETDAYVKAMKMKGGAAPGPVKPELRLLSGGASSVDGNTPHFLLGKQGNYLGIFPSREDATGWAKDQLGSYRADVDTATTNLSPRERDDKIAALKDMTKAQSGARPPVRDREAQRQYTEAVRQQQFMKQNSNLASLDRATVPSYGINYTVQRLPTGIVKVSHPDGHAWLYDAKTGAMRGGDSQGGHTMAALGALNQFLQRSK